MIVLNGKTRETMDDQAFCAFAASFERVVIDVGTGDGKNVCKSAKGAPDTLFVGLDAAAENMIDASRKARKRPEKGGLSNVLFVVSAAETPPQALLGAADELTVYFPWGSLLSGLICAQPCMMQSLRSLCKRGARFTFVTTYSDSFEAAEIQKRGLPALSLEYFLHEYREKLLAEGFVVEEAVQRGNDYAASFESAWAKRLGHGRARVFYRVTGFVP